MITIELMKMEHIDDVYEIECASFPLPWSKRDFVKELTENKLALYIVARCDGVIAGYAGMWHIVNEGHITNVAVAEAWRKRGVGDLLVTRLLALAVEKGMVGVTLEVRMGNVRAMSLYAKHGFKPEGIRKGYYTDTNEDAVIMWKWF